MRSRLSAVLLPALVLAGLIGCTGFGSSHPPGTTFRGHVVFNDFEGGFYGIVTREGKRLDPLSLPQELQKKGIRVRGRYRAREGVVTTRMWGRPVEILEIRREGKGQ